MECKNQIKESSLSNLVKVKCFEREFKYKVIAILA